MGFVFAELNELERFAETTSKATQCSFYIDTVIREGERKHFPIRQTEGSTSTVFR